jgi:pimeloyl-ACP methyl ester carboxylesterase
LNAEVPVTIRSLRSHLVLLSLVLVLGALPTTGVSQDGFREEEVRIRIDAEVTLAGSLVLPSEEGPFPAVILLSTSMAEDRDASRSGFGPLRVMAQYLAEAGIASVRWDDRGMGESTGRQTYQYTIADFLGDASAAVGFLKARKEIAPERIGVMGISLGGMLSVLVASQQPDLAFIIPISGPVPDLRTVNYRYRRRTLESQGRSTEEIANILDIEARVVEVTMSGEGREELEADMRAAERLNWERLTDERRQRYQDFEAYFDQSWYGQYLPFVGTPFMRTFYDMDLETALEGVTCPAYYVYGGADRQVVATEAAPMISKGMAEAGSGDWAIRVFPQAGHYITRPWGTFAPGFLESIAVWILDHTSG